MKTLPIDLGWLTMALEDNSLEHRHYLDLQTGNVILVSDYSEDPEADEAEIEENPDRYLFIEPLEGGEGFRVMEDFVDSLPEGEARRDLMRVLGRAKPFRNFKEALRDWPELREKWFVFHNERLEARAREWLAGHQIEPVPAPPGGGFGFPPRDGAEH